MAPVQVEDFVFCSSIYKCPYDEWMDAAVPVKPTEWSVTWARTSLTHIHMVTEYVPSTAQSFASGTFNKFNSYLGYTHRPVISLFWGKPALHYSLLGGCTLLPRQVHSAKTDHPIDRGQINICILPPSVGFSWQWRLQVKSFYFPQHRAWTAPPPDCSQHFKIETWTRVWSKEHLPAK